MHTHSRRRRRLHRALLPAGIAAILGMSTPALADNAGGAGNDAASNSSADAGIAELDAVRVVAGSIQQGQEQIENRRNTFAIIDSLIQDDTGDLPDQNVTESLRRVPGVGALYRDDEGQFVTIRGITPDLNHTTVDGITMISVGDSGQGGRRVDMGMIPSQVARKVDVHKTFTPDLESGAVGGVINLVPRSAFDNGDKQLLIVDAQGSYADYSKVPDVNNVHGDPGSNLGGGLSALWSNSFGSDNQFGVTLAGNFTSIQRDLTKYNANGLLFFADDGSKVNSPLDGNWNGYRGVPDTARSYDFNNRVSDRRGLSARFEYRPSDRAYHSLLLFGYDQDYTENRNEFSLNTLSGMQRQTEDSGTLGVGRVDSAFYMDDIERRTRGAIHHSRFDFGEKSKLDVRAGYSYSGYENLAPEARYRISNAGGLLNYRFEGKHYAFDVSDPALYSDPARYRMASATTTGTRSEADALEFKLDFSHNMETYSTGWGYQVGAGIRDFQLERDITVTNYLANGSTLAGISDSSFTPSHFPFAATLVDYEAWQAQVLPGLAVNAATSLANSGKSDYRYEETIGWGYGSLAYASERTRVMGGLRYDQSDYTGRAPQTVDGVFSPVLVGASGHYGHWLPSANLLHSFSDRWRLKASYSRTLGRPEPNQIAAPATINETEQTISRGNPDLTPRKSDNYDLALEWFIDGYDSALTFGVFHKEIRDDIFDMSAPVTIDGLEYLATQPVNAETSKITGLEWGYINNTLPGLPGFLRDKVGVAANLMHAKGEMNYLVNGQRYHLDQLVDQSEWLGNVAVFYALPRGGEVRLAYNHQSANLTTLGTSPWLHRGTDDFHSIDLTMRHRINDRFLVKFEARNLTNEQRHLAVGEDLEWWRSEGESGRTFTVHLIYKM